MFGCLFEQQILQTNHDLLIDFYKQRLKYKSDLDFF